MLGKLRRLLGLLRMRRLERKPARDLAPMVRTTLLRGGYFGPDYHQSRMGGRRFSTYRARFHSSEVIELVPVVLIIAALLGATRYTSSSASVALSPPHWMRKAVAMITFPEAAPRSKRHAAPRRNQDAVLVVESDPALRRTAEHTLRGQGYSVLLAENGEEAARIFGSKDDIAVVVLAAGPGARQTRDALRVMDPDVKIVISKKPGTYTFAGLASSAPLPRPYDSSQLADAVRKAAGQTHGAGQ